MTIHQQHIIKEAVRACANQYNCAPIISLERGMQEAYESNANQGPEELAFIFGDVVLDSHVLQLQSKEQELDHYAFWWTVAKELKK